MEMGMVGLGRMGGNMVLRLLRSGHRVIAHNRTVSAIEPYARQGAVRADSLEEFVAAFQTSPRVMWVMVPAGDATTATIRRLAELGDAGDIIIDGGNSNWKVALQDAAMVREHGLHYLDAGTSGGVWGLENGYCLMVGGERTIYDHCVPLFTDLAPTEGGLVFTGAEGSGHFVKMVHNGIEYGLMQSYAEGFEIMRQAESFPGMDLHAIADAWRFGSVVRSWLLDLIERGLAEDPELAQLKGYVEDTGEGRWTLEAAINEAVPAPVIAMSIFARFRSRLENTYADRMLAMMRRQFGGHPVVSEGGPPPPG